MIDTRNFYLESEPGITVGIWQVTSSMKADQSPYRSWAQRYPSNIWLDHAWSITAAETLGWLSFFLVQVLPRSRKDDGDDKDGEWWSSALGDGKTVVSNWVLLILFVTIFDKSKKRSSQMSRTVSEDNFSQNLDFRFSISKSANLDSFISNSLTICKSGPLHFRFSICTGTHHTGRGGGGNSFTRWNLLSNV